MRPDPASARADAPGLLLVHAHPDDEVIATGGLIARSLAEGHRVDLVTCTGGEEGEIHDPTLSYEEAFPRLREIRELELRCALEALQGPYPGELHLHLLGYRDSGMMGTEPNARPEAFWNADLEEAAGRLVPIVRAARPAVMVTYDPNGNYGHPDHINAHRVAVAAWEASGDGSRFPDAGPPHAVAKFYEIAFNRDRWMALMGDMAARGIALPWDAGSSEEAESDASDAPDASDASDDSWQDEFGVPEADITTTVEVAAYATPKRAAMECHRTQRQDFGWLLDLPDDLAARVISPEHYMLTHLHGGEVAAGVRETSVFDGL